MNDLGSLTVIVLWGIIALYTIVASFVGLWLAFSASFLLGILVLIVEPAPLVLGTAYFFWGSDLAEKFMNWL